MNSIQTQALTKRFGRVNALAGLDFSVPEGAVYALVGPMALTYPRKVILPAQKISPENPANTFSRNFDPGLFYAKR